MAKRFLIDTDVIIDYLRGQLLATLNKKHFPMLASVVVPYRKT
jgi:predicted nucleic acid-binding protein